MSDILPARTLRRPKQHSVCRSVPGSVARSVISEDTLTDSTARQRGLFSMPRGRGDCEQERGSHDHGRALWNLLCLELWMRQFSG